MEAYSKSPSTNYTNHGPNIITKNNIGSSQSSSSIQSLMAAAAALDHVYKANPPSIGHSSCSLSAKTEVSSSGPLFGTQEHTVSIDNVVRVEIRDGKLKILDHTDDALSIREHRNTGGQMAFIDRESNEIYVKSGLGIAEGATHYIDGKAFVYKYMSEEQEQHLEQFIDSYITTHIQETSKKDNKDDVNRQRDQSTLTPIPQQMRRKEPKEVVHFITNLSQNLNALQQMAFQQERKDIRDDQKFAEEKEILKDIIKKKVQNKEEIQSDALQFSRTSTEIKLDQTGRSNRAKH